MSDSATTLAIILARSGASRLPGKMTMGLGDETVIERVIRNTRAISGVGGIVLATTTSPQDDVFEPLAAQLGVPVFRGSEEDVVERMFLAQREFAPDADAVIRVCADNPLFSPRLAADAVAELRQRELDLITPYEYPTLPFGFSPVVMSGRCLERIQAEATDLVHREHVENFCFDNADSFAIGYQIAPEGMAMPELILTLDYPEDMKRIRLADSLVGDVQGDDKHRLLIERVRSCSIALGGIQNETATRLAGTIRHITGSDPIIADTAQNAAHANEADLSISLTMPESTSVPRGSIWVTTDNGHPTGLSYTQRELDEPYQIFELDGGNSTPQEYLAAVIPALLKRCLAGFPPRAGAHQVALSARDKVAHGARRKGFACFEDSLFPPRVESSDALTADQEEEIRFWQQALDRTAPSNNDLFATLHAGPSESSLAYQWNSPELQRQRACLMNQTLRENTTARSQP